VIITTASYLLVAVVLPPALTCLKFVVTARPQRKPYLCQQSTKSPHQPRIRSIYPRQTSHEYQTVCTGPFWIVDELISCLLRLPSPIEVHLLLIEVLFHPATHIFPVAKVIQTHQMRDPNSRHVFAELSRVLSSDRNRTMDLWGLNHSLYFWTKQARKQAEHRKFLPDMCIYMAHLLR
jgi:hypothetical protein